MNVILDGIKGVAALALAAAVCGLVFGVFVAAAWMTVRLIIGG